MPPMKLNADVGEGTGSDDALMPWIDCANIACGGHAGGPDEMRRTVALALTHDVSIGAHPGYPDPENFGRVSLVLPPEEITALVHEQIDRLDAVCRDLGAEIA